MEDILLYIIAVVTAVLAGRLAGWLLFNGWIFKVAAGMVIVGGVFGIRLSIVNPSETPMFHLGISIFFILMGIGFLLFDKYKWQK